jgi:hypothetical protein
MHGTRLRDRRLVAEFDVRTVPGWSYDPEVELADNGAVHTVVLAPIADLPALRTRFCT